MLLGYRLNYTAFHIRAYRFRAGTTLRRRCYARLLCFSPSHGPLLTLSVNFSSTVYVDNGQVPRLGCNSYSLEITTTNRMRFKLWGSSGSCADRSQIGRGVGMLLYGMQCRLNEKYWNVKKMATSKIDIDFCRKFAGFLSRKSRVLQKPT